MGESSKRIEQILVELKDTSELMIDLAYSSLLFGNRDIAAKVMAMEEDMDVLHTALELNVLDNHRPSKEKLALIRIGLAVEAIADAATAIADVVCRGAKPHPVFRMAIEESDETILSTTISENSPLLGKSLDELSLEDDIGMKIVAVLTGLSVKERKWVYNPPGSFELRAGDEIIVRGYSKGRRRLFSLANPERL